MTHSTLTKAEVMQFGLICKVTHERFLQGSGLGDNIFEFDGAENLTLNQEPVQQFITLPQLQTPNPVTARPLGDNASVQFRNNIFIGKGDKLVRADGDDGDGSSGYGHNGL